jgi:outer membrane protein TolC
MTIKSRCLCLVMFAALLFLPVSIQAVQPLTLEESIAIALKNSLVINIAKEGAKGAEARKREAITGFLPKFSTSYNYTRLNEDPLMKLPDLSYPFTGILPSSVIALVNGLELPAGTKNNYNWSIEVRQPLFAGGGILANYQASKIAEDAALVEESAKVQDVVQDVKISYYNILRAERLRDTARQAVEMLNAHRDVAQNFYRVGLIPKNDLLQTEVELANGKQTKVQNGVELAKSRLNTVLKRELLSPVEVVDILGYQPLNQSFQECLDIARQHRPELKLSILKAEQAGKMVRAAQSEYFPTVGLAGQYARFGDTPSVSGSEYKDMESWQVMAVASWNFWEWGKTKFRVDAGRAMENQAIDQGKELNDQIALEIKSAYLLLQEAESQIAVSQKVIDQAEENFRISEARYKERVARSTEVLDAQALLTKAKYEYTNALANYNTFYARLQRAMGVIDR